MGDYSLISSSSSYTNEYNNDRIYTIQKLYDVTTTK
jgi:hypothetical protein